MARKMSNNDEMHSIEMENLKRDKEVLLSEIATAEVTYANAMMR